MAVIIAESKCVLVRRPDEQPVMLCTEEEIDAGEKFIKEQDDLNGQISESIGRTIQHIKKESTVNDCKKYSYRLHKITN